MYLALFIIAPTSHCQKLLHSLVLLLKLAADSFFFCRALEEFSAGICFLFASDRIRIEASFRISSPRSFGRRVNGYRFLRSWSYTDRFFCIQERAEDAKRERERERDPKGTQREEYHMSQMALRNVNAVLLTERRNRSNSGKKRAMKVELLSGCNDENLELSKRVAAANGCHFQQPPPLPADRASQESTLAMETAPATELEYVVSEDLKDLEDAHVQLTVRIPASLLLLSLLSLFFNPKPSIPLL